MISVFTYLVGLVLSGPPPVCYRIEQIKRYGDFELVAGNLDARSLKAEGGVLSEVRGMLRGPSGDIYVLDRYFQKIVVFGTDGVARRVVLGGNGEGPGEFRIPRQMTTTARGFSVIDYQLARITEFDWTGELLTTYRLKTPRPWYHLIRNDTAWITYRNSDGAGPSFQQVVLSTGNVLSGPPLHSEDAKFGLNQSATFGADGEFILSTARPGVWMVQSGRKWMRTGRPLYPKDNPPQSERVSARNERITPSQYAVGGIALIGRSLVIQGVSGLTRPFDWNNPPKRNDFAFSLAVFRRTGEFLGSVRLPDGVSTEFMSSDPRTGHIFLRASEPYPQVLEVRLVACK